MHWRDMPKGKEKYQAYLCSREWGLLRESVKRRNGGKCERCKVRAIDHVHHLTYIRCYEERLSDLQGLCKGCHDFVHGRSNEDPAIRREVTVEAIDGSRKTVRSFYLAGKITKDHWREEIVDGWAEERSNAYFASISGKTDKSWGVVERAGSLLGEVFLDYTGPWWSDTDSAYGGHAWSGCCGGPHASLCDGDDVCSSLRHEDGTIPSATLSRLEKGIASNVAKAIMSADIVFAWINSNDCLGTLFEIGIAVASEKIVVIASPGSFDQTETWLPRRFCYAIKADSPGLAWDIFWRLALENEQRMEVQ